VPIDNLATMTINTVSFGEETSLTSLATPTPMQRRAFQLLGVNPRAE
jgi:hypothetical protein